MRSRYKAQQKREVNIFSMFMSILMSCQYIYIAGWIFEKVIDSYKPGVPSTPPPKLSSLKLLEKSQLSEYPN